ncbi:universal stress protein [Halobacteriales archaeon QS_5_70_15]|nr:MAG: universal stress protein [Halobacteriales archaeon QS_5_70_15]
MVTYLVGTDGAEASEALRDFLERSIAPGDTVEVVNVIPDNDVETIDAGEAALEAFEGAFDDRVTVRTRQVNRGRDPSTELVEMAREVDADRIVMGLRQHSRTERIIFGSVAQSLLKKVDRPITLVPLPEYTVVERE